jgi:hypothetical protein
MIMVLPWRIEPTTEPLLLLDTFTVENSIVLPCAVEKVRFVNIMDDVLRLETSSVLP